MAASQFIVQIASTTTLQRGSQAFESGTLQAVSACIDTTSIPPANVYARILLTLTTPDRTTVVAHLAQGYIGNTSSIGWTGAITLTPGMAVLVEAMSDFTTPVRIGVITDK